MTTRKAKCLICARSMADLDSFGKCGRCRGERPARAATPEPEAPAPIVERGPGPVEPEVAEMLDLARTTTATVREAHPERSTR
jgi:hypothetical protein